MQINYKDQSYQIEIVDYNTLIDFIETQFNSELYSMYQIIFYDDEDEIFINSEEDLLAAMELCKTKNKELIFNIQNANIEASNYILKRQISQDKSNIYADSLYQINQKLKEYQEFQSSQSIEQSIFEISDENLTIQQIMQHYQKQFLKFIANYQDQKLEHKQKFAQLYQETFENLLQRMNQKLINQFKLISQKNINQQEQQNFQI